MTTTNRGHDPLPSEGVDTGAGCGRMMEVRDEATKILEGAEPCSVYHVAATC
jgi:hypothetical protein